MAPSLEEPVFTSSFPNPKTNGKHSTATSNKKSAMEHSTAADKFTRAHSTEPLKQDHPDTDHQHIWYITGPAGCGKSTVAQYIASALNLPFLEGDNFHPQANINKMAEGHPLTDADRWDWLIALRRAALCTLSNQPITAPSPNAGGKGSPPPPPRRSASAEPEDLPAGVVLTCSALKEKYRDVLRIASYNNRSIRVHFVYLHASEEVLLQRVAARKGHYMGAAMVHSQFESLEVPDLSEEWDVLRIDVDGTKEEVERKALREVEAAVRMVVEEED